MTDLPMYLLHISSCSTLSSFIPCSMAKIILYFLGTGYIYIHADIMVSKETVQFKFRV